MRNDSLPSSLQNDRDRCVTNADGPSVRAQDLIVVSGDIVPGVPPDTANSYPRLSAQTTKLAEVVPPFQALAQHLLPTPG